MNKLQVLVLILLLTIAFSGYSENHNMKNIEIQLPEWYGIQDNPNYIHSFGMRTSGNNEMAIIRAKTDAFANASYYIKDYNLKGDNIEFPYDSGTPEDVIKRISRGSNKITVNAEYKDAKPTIQTIYFNYSEEATGYTVFVRLSIPIDGINYSNIELKDQSDQ